MLLKVGIAMMVLSMTLAVGVAIAVVGFPGAASETTAVSSVEPRSSEATAPTAQRKLDRGEKLEINAEEEPSGEESSGEEPSREEPSGEKAKAPPPLPVADWPRPTDDEVAFASGPRYYDPEPGTQMSLTIESLGLYSVPVTSSDDLLALDTGLMHVPETSLPWDEGGRGKNVFVAGHYLGYPGTSSRLVFYNLDKLAEGDDIFVEDGLGGVYEYRVRESFAASPEESWVMGQEVGRDMLTLQTCIPPGFEERLIVRADRV